MNLAEMLTVLDAVRSIGCRFWIEGGGSVALWIFGTG
jgi:hypothetical protein